MNCMNNYGMIHGYDIVQLSSIRKILTIPLIASGGAGEMHHFQDVFNKCDVSGALAASVFHSDIFRISDLKNFLKQKKVEIRL